MYISQLSSGSVFAGGGWEGGGGGVGHGNCTKKIPQGFTVVVIRSGNFWYPCVLPLNIVFVCLKCASSYVCACLFIFMCVFFVCVCVRVYVSFVCLIAVVWVFWGEGK